MLCYEPIYTGYSMRHFKSERLKKLEAEYNDLEQWLKLGLVPKKDIEKHKEEMLAIQQRIEEEKERLQFLKDSGEMDEYIAPKRGPSRAGYAEMPTIPDIDLADSNSGLTDSGFDTETEFTEEASYSEEHEGEEDDLVTTVDEVEEEEEEEEESYFSEKNRWRRGGTRGGIMDPDADDW